LREQLESGVSHEEICIIVRSDDELSRADDAAAGAGCKSRNLNDSKSIDRKTIPIATMHMAKGMEFRSVVVMACDDEVIPLPSRIESVGDDADLQEVYATERQLLYVACTRARDCLLVSGVTPASEFLDDFE
jgi:superfamily I DNA/RNA helicase